MEIIWLHLQTWRHISAVIRERNPFHVNILLYPCSLFVSKFCTIEIQYMQTIWGPGDYFVVTKFCYISLCAISGVACSARYLYVGWLTKLTEIWSMCQVIVKIVNMPSDPLSTLVTWFHQSVFVNKSSSLPFYLFYPLFAVIIFIDWCMVTILGFSELLSLLGNWHSTCFCLACKADWETLHHYFRQQWQRQHTPNIRSKWL